jgi:hypothetical protein
MPLNKKKLIAVATISAVLVSLFGIQPVEVIRANPLSHYKGPSFPHIYISSPKNQTIYNSPEVILDMHLATIRSRFNVSSSQYSTEKALWLKYEIDGESYSFADLTYIQMSTPYCTYGSANLSKLSNGMHFLKVYGETTLGTAVNSTVTFEVNELAIPTSSPSPKPTPNPSQETSPSPSPSPAPREKTNPEPTLTIIPIQFPITTVRNNLTLDLLPVLVSSIIVAVGLALGVIVYHKRRMI